MTKKSDPHKLDLSGYNFGNPEEVFQKAIQGFHDDPDFNAIIQNLKLDEKQIRDNLPQLMDFQKNFHACKETDANESGGPSYEISAEMEEGYLHFKYAPRKRDLAKLKLETSYIHRSFPDDWLKYRLGNIDKSRDRNKAILALSNLLKGNKSDWVYLYGGSREGKSYILACFANDYALLERGSIAFCSTPDLFSELQDKAINQKAAFADSMDSLKNVSLLILDDFGNEYISEFVFSRILFPLISSRAKADMQTLFASNFSYEEIMDLYAPKVGGPKAKQLISIIKERADKGLQLNGVPDAN